MVSFSTCHGVFCLFVFHFLLVHVTFPPVREHGQGKCKPADLHRHRGAWAEVGAHVAHWLSVPSPTSSQSNESFESGEIEPGI